MDTSIINRDLVSRWSRRRWFWCVFLAFALQVGALFALWQPLRIGPLTASGPVLEFPRASASKGSGDWLELEDPMLFAAPSWHGVSALAWMTKPSLDLKPLQPYPAINYLAYTHGLKLVSPISVASAPMTAAHRRSLPEPTVPVQPPPAPEPRSTLVAEGFDYRSLMGLPELPVQLHSDAVGPTILQAGIDADGLVVSTRIVTSSGSRRADTDASGIARRLRFEPFRTLSAGAPEITWGKLIFRWHALDLASTNAVRR